MPRADIAIVGTGPAGISAALNGTIRHKKVLLFGSKDLSLKVGKSERIDNYPGEPEITGPALNQKLQAHLQKMGVEITEKRITGIYHMGSYFILLSDQEEFEATTVILATGMETTKPLPGEREFLGRGVSYCATCDGNLYKGKTIAVVCDSQELEEEAAYLAGIAGKVYYQPLFKGSQFALAQHLESPIAQVAGERKVNKIFCKDGTELAVDGVFFLKQSVSAGVLLNGLAMDGNHVAVDRTMSTNIRGCFAAGDCTGTPYQIAKAVGEGNIAAHSAFHYLSSLK